MLSKKITRPRLQKFLEAHQTTKAVLNIGCGNNEYATLFPNSTTLEVAPREGVHVDIVGDIHDVHMISDNQFEVIVCTEVLEHLHTPQKAISEMRRILKPGGTLLLTTRFIFPIHDAPGDYYRYTKYGLVHLLEEWNDVQIQAEANTVETLGVLCQRIGFQCTTLHMKPFKIFWLLLAKIFVAFSWIVTKEYGDIQHKTKEDNILSSGYYVSAIK